MSRWKRDLQRRKFMGLLGAVGGAGLAGCTGSTDDSGGSGGDSTASESSPTTFKIGGSPTGTLDDWSILYEATNIESVEFTNVPNQGTAQRILEGDLAEQLAVVQALSTSEENFPSALREIEPDRLSNWDNLQDFFVESIAGNEVSPTRVDESGKLVGLPVTAQGDSFAYDIDVTGKELNSYEALFDPEWKGQVALWNSPLSGFIKTPIYLKSNNLMDIDQVDNMTKEEVTKVADFLIEKKKEGQFLTFWDSYNEAVNLLVSGESPVLDAWYPMVLDARDKGLDGARYALVPDEGYAKWTHNSHLLDGAELNRPGMEDLAYEFINFTLSPAWGAAMLDLRAYVSGIDPELIKEYINENPDQFETDTETLMNRADQSKERLQGPGGWLNKQPENAEWYEQEWNRFVNA